MLGGVAVAARRRREGDADHAEHDSAHREVLGASGMLAEDALGQEQQHEQPDRERRLDDHERREQERHDLKRPAEYRQTRAQEPARAARQAPHERHAQVLVRRRLAGVERLDADP